MIEAMRARLPFDVTVYAGQAPVDGTRAVVSEFVAGTPVTLAGIDLALAESIGRAIAAVHALPTSLVTDAGLPTQSSVDAHRATLALVDRAAATSLVPASTRNSLVSKAIAKFATAVGVAPAAPAEAPKVAEAPKAPEVVTGAEETAAPVAVAEAPADRLAPREPASQGGGDNILGNIVQSALDAQEQEPSLFQLVTRRYRALTPTLTDRLP